MNACQHALSNSSLRQNEVAHDLAHQLGELVLGQALSQGISDHVLGGDIGDSNCATIDLLADIVIGEVDVLAGIGVHRVVAHRCCSLAVGKEVNG